MPTIGNDFRVEIKVNESIINAQSIKVLIRKPSSIVFLEKVPTLLDEVSDIIKYDVASDFNDIAGEWIFKVEITNSEGNKATSTTSSIFVDDSI